MTAGQGGEPKRARAVSGAGSRTGSGGGPGAGSGGRAGARGGGEGAAPPAPPSGAALALRIAGYLLLVVLGVLVAVAGALVQDGWFPGGLLLALAGQVALCYGGVKAMGTRLGGALPAASWAAVVLLLTATRPEGDFVFAAGFASYVFLLGGMFSGVMCATLPKVTQPGRLAARLAK
ncbi:DUF6113 family protein [Streptomyces sp. P1-3]|uniref:DUF6113 family protein n=1 Tax=Streptomyces sp. P1-3 TaxID=3421658 RepID=UPI003D367C05